MRIDRVVDDRGNLLGIIFSQGGPKSAADWLEQTHFFTEPEEGLQLGFITRERGSQIRPHRHREVVRPARIEPTKEVLFLQKGRILVNFYGEGSTVLESRTVIAGDLVFLLSGGHGFEILNDLEMWEVKQGPYHKELDKEPIR